VTTSQDHYVRDGAVDIEKAKQGARNMLNSVGLTRELVRAAFARAPRRERRMLETTVRIRGNQYIRVSSWDEEPARSIALQLVALAGTL